jgi:hypothetical protein
MDAVTGLVALTGNVMLAVMLLLNPAGNTGEFVDETARIPWLSILNGRSTLPSEARTSVPVLFCATAEPVPYPDTLEPVLTVRTPVTQTGAARVLVMVSGIDEVMFTLIPPESVAVTAVGKFEIDAVTGFVAETGSVIDAVMLELPGNVVGQLEIDAVTGLVALTGRVIVPVMFALKPVGKLETLAVTGFVAETGNVID